MEGLRGIYEVDLNKKKYHFDFQKNTVKLL